MHSTIARWPKWILSIPTQERVLVMKSTIECLTSRLREIRDDVEAMDHHQSERIVQELEEVIGVLSEPTARTPVSAAD